MEHRRCNREKVDLHAVMFGRTMRYGSTIKVLAERMTQNLTVCCSVWSENGAEAMEEGEGADEGEESDGNQQEQAEAAPAAEPASVRAEGANVAAPAAAVERSMDHTDRYLPPG